MNIHFAQRPGRKTGEFEIFQRYRVMIIKSSYCTFMSCTRPHAHAHTHIYIHTRGIPYSHYINAYTHCSFACKSDLRSRWKYLILYTHTHIYIYSRVYSSILPTTGNLTRAKAHTHTHVYIYIRTSWARP